MSGAEFSIRVPADPSHLKAIRAFFHEVLLADFGDDAEMLVLALDESCSNVLKHQRDRHESNALTVRATCGPDGARFEVCDFCCEGDVERIRPRDLGEVRPGGLGTHFVDRIMDRVSFEPDPARPGRLLLVLEKKLPPRGEQR